ncbi:membrane protein [Candidatus Magnetomorum sp. HK-1]|nr:membrane protein [Candidatus Magnetomorum sp. HK-1]
MIGSFTTLLTAVGAKGLNPAVAITTLIKGGLSTALVSSLIAAIMACIVMSYLSFTDRRIVELKGKINNICLDRYQLQSTNSFKFESEKKELFKNAENEK